MSDLRYWIALNYLPDIGPVLVRRLLAAFGSPENIFAMPVNELKSIDGVGEERGRGISGFNEWDKVSREIEAVVKNDVRLITCNDRSYPEALRCLNDAPPVLYVKGDLKETDKYAVAIVGSRRSTHYCTRVSETISHDLACLGITIVSGMARGVDSASHKGALRAKGRTLAVIGSGIDILYPPENRGLMNAITSSGAVIS